MGVKKIYSFYRKETKFIQELNEEAVQVVKKGSPGLARLIDLVAHGIDVNVPLDQQSQQPNVQLTGNYLSLLHVAASVPDNCLVLEYLIKNNAEVNRLDATGATPLDWAAKFQPTKDKSREFKLLQLRGGTLTSAPTNTNESTVVASTPHAVNTEEGTDGSDHVPMSATVGPVLSEKPPSNLPPMVARKASVGQPAVIKTASLPPPPTSAQLSPRVSTVGPGVISGPVTMPNNSGTTPPLSPKGPQGKSAPSNAVARGPPPVPASPRDPSAQPTIGVPSSPRDLSGTSPPTSPRKGSLAANMPPNPRPPSGFVATNAQNGLDHSLSSVSSTPPIAIRPSAPKSNASDTIGAKMNSPLSLSLEKVSSTPPKQPTVGSPTSLGFRPAPPKILSPSGKYSKLRDLRCTFQK